MHIITNEADFIGWVETTIRRTGDQVSIPIGLVRSYHAVFRAFEQGGAFSVGSDNQQRATTFGALLDSVRQDGGRTETASARINYFLGEVYARAISRNGSLSMKGLVAATRNALQLDAADLFVKKSGRIRSSTKFEKKFDCSVRVARQQEASPFEIAVRGMLSAYPRSRTLRSK